MGWQKMKISVVFVLCAISGSSLASVASLADSPPIPYSVASGGQSASVHLADHFGADGYNVQSGYEEYLIPGTEHRLLPSVDGIEAKGHHQHYHHGHLTAVFKHLVSAGRKVIPKVAVGAVVLLGLFLIGGCLNALVCSVAPFCSISFAPGFGVTKDTVRSYLDPDRISTTATYVMDAIRKYRDMYETLSNEIDGGKKIKK